mmetsp:Transcript_15210/g.22879  ORF Transcript_15210/g.22879 Transcript_15210/m.22879 type:complete len:132 (-) Transcript_15210:138-533(-)
MLPWYILIIPDKLLLESKGQTIKTNRQFSNPTARLPIQNTWNYSQYSRTTQLDKHLFLHLSLSVRSGELSKSPRKDLYSVPAQVKALLQVSQDMDRSLMCRHLLTQQEQLALSAGEQGERPSRIPGTTCVS